MTALSPVNLQSPGALGLNTEDQDDVMDQKFCTVAYNCVMSRNGRIESREGWSKINSTAATGAPALDVVHSYVSDSGTEILVSTGGNKIWTGDTSLTDATGSLTVTEDHWQFQNSQGNTYGAQSGHEPIWWDGSGNFEYLVDQNTAWAGNTAKSLGDLVIPASRNGYYYECTTANTTDATELDGGAWAWSTTVGGTTTETGGVIWTTREIPQSDACLAAFGRLWLHDDTTLYYSDLLIPQAFDTGGTAKVGSSGKIDLNTVWVTSNDSIVAIATHNKFIVILCKKSVVIYANADDIGNITLSEVVENIGCVARDTVQSLGQDLIWLSEEGVRSLSRTVLQNNMPLSTLTSQVRTELINQVALESNSSAIRSVYNESRGLYMITLPTAGTVYVFDMRLMSSQVVRPFIWDSIKPYGMLTRRNGDLVFGMSGGFLGKYATFLDNASTYVMNYKSGWIDVGSNGFEMIWKKMRIYLHSSFSLTTSANWAYDFETKTTSQNKAVVSSDVSEYNVSEYNVAEYGSGTSAIELNFNLTGTGELIKVGFQATINGGKVGINKIALQAKRGRLN